MHLEKEVTNPFVIVPTKPTPKPRHFKDFLPTSLEAPVKKEKPPLLPDQAESLQDLQKEFWQSPGSSLLCHSRQNRMHIKQKTSASNARCSTCSWAGAATRWWGRRWRRWFWDLQLQIFVLVQA
jgi:hypothetical protein